MKLLLFIKNMLFMRFFTFVQNDVESRARLAVLSLQNSTGFARFLLPPRNRYTIWRGPRMIRLDPSTTLRVTMQKGFYALLKVTGEHFEILRRAQNDNRHWVI